MRHPYWIGAWAQFAGPGAVADQVRFEREWTALREYAPPAAFGSSATCRSTSPTAAPTSPRGRRSSPTARSQARRRMHSAPPASAGATRCTTGRRTARAATAGGSSVSGAHSSSSTSSRVDHFRGFVSYWAVPARQQDGQARPLAPRARRASSSTRSQRAARRAAAHRRGSRRHHARRLPPPRRARPAGDGGPPVGLRRLAAQPASAREPRPQRGRLHVASTTPTRSRASSAASARRTGSSSTSRTRRPHRSPIVPAQDVLGLGSEARMNRPGTHEGQLAVAARARPAHAGARATPARARREVRAARARLTISLSFATTPCGSGANSRLGRILLARRNGVVDELLQLGELRRRLRYQHVRERRDRICVRRRRRRSTIEAELSDAKWSVSSCAAIEPVAGLTNFPAAFSTDA